MSPVVRANWGLAAAALLLGLLFWLEPGSESAHYPFLTLLKPAQINHIQIEVAGKPIVNLTRAQGRWLDEANQEEVGDTVWIERLLHIAELPSLQRFPAPKDLAPFGLDTPGKRLQLNDVVIAWGGLDPVSRLRYVLIGRQIHLITDSYTHHLSRGSGAMHRSPPPKDGHGA